MLLKNGKEDCCGCGNCALVCPQKCIYMNRDEEGFLYPTITENQCVHCKLCEAICPIINQPNYSKVERSVAAYNLDDKIRYESSSGGVFFLLAKKTIESGGTVYGVICDNNKKIKHSRAQTIEELYPMMGSKYVQSDLGCCYQNVSTDLMNGKNVLFSGTPCQVAALKQFIHRQNTKDDKLIIVDIICHGVPSPGIWQRYLNQVLNISDRDIDTIKFRDKVSGWKEYSISFKGVNYQYSSKADCDEYLFSFRKNLSLRPSCYNCKFKGYNKKYSDISLGDFWGIDKVIENFFDDDKGVSWITANSIKGIQLLDDIKNLIWIKDVEQEKVIKYNESAVLSVKTPKMRKFYFKKIFKNNDFKYVTMKAAGEIGLVGILRKIKRKLKKNG